MYQDCSIEDLQEIAGLKDDERFSLFHEAKLGIIVRDRITGISKLTGEINAINDIIAFQGGDIVLMTALKND